jgi:hypothetical protein
VEVDCIGEADRFVLYSDWEKLSSLVQERKPSRCLRVWIRRSRYGVFLTDCGP